MTQERHLKLGSCLFNYSIHPLFDQNLRLASFFNLFMRKDGEIEQKTIFSKQIKMACYSSHNSSVNINGSHLDPYLDRDGEIERN